MDWKDTLIDVCDEEAMGKIYGWMWKLDDEESGDKWWMEHLAIAKAQAEISYKAGYTQALSDMLKKAHDKLKEAGVR